MNVTLYNNTGLDEYIIRSLELIGVVKNNWMKRYVELYRDPEDDAFVYSVGKSFDGSKIVIAREQLSECLNFRIAIDYWKHGRKIYVRD